MRYVRRSLVSVAIALAALSCAEHARAQTATQQREAAVLKARTGQMAEAQTALRAMLAAGVDDGLVAMDLVALLQQDGKPAEAVDVFERATTRDTPEYALLAAAHAYRDLQRTEAAERLAREGLRRFDEQPVWPLLLSLVLSDAGRTEEALAILKQPAALRAPAIERLRVEAYAWQRANDLFKAFNLYNDAIALSPDDASLKREAAAILERLNAPYGAAALAGMTRSIEAQQAAALVRDGRMQLDALSGGFEGTDAALARLDSLLKDTAPDDTVLRRRIRLDRLVALRDRVRMQEAKAEAEALRRDAPLPAYAEEAYGDALLYLREPGPARDAYRRMLAQNPNDVPAKYGVFYASIELEDFSTAYRTIDSLVAVEPVWRSYRDDPTRYANFQRADAELTAALSRFYGNQLADAWTRVAPLIQTAPAASDARIAASHISSARGWPRRATEEAEIGASLAPDRLASRIALAETATANYRFDDANRIADDLMARHPENPSVKRLARDLDAIRRWDFGFDAVPSDSEGGGANASGEAVTLHGRLTSPPIGNNWRFFAISDYANAHPPEGFTDRGRGGLGVEWRSTAVTATIVPTRSWGTLSKNSVAGAIDWRATDQLRFSVAAERFSWETPLRALLHDVTADDYSARATYRWHESRAATANVAYQPFTDGNRRWAGGAAFNELLIDRPALDVTGLIEIYASRNTRVDAPYYNPARDLSASGGVRAEHTAWRRYDISLVQAIGADLGLYTQRGFASDWTGTLTYEHRWRFDPLTSFSYGLRVSRRVYDGAPENTVAFVAGVGRKF